MRVSLAAVVMVGAAVPVLVAPVSAAASPTDRWSVQPTVTEAERAVAIAEPAMVTIDVTWVGYVRHRATGDLLDDQSVSASTQCGGVGVSSAGHVLTTGDCLSTSAVAADIFRQVANRRVAKGLATPDQVPALVADMLTNATIVGQPVTAPAQRTVVVRRAVTADGPVPATVVGIADPADGDAALIKVEKNNQPMVEIAAADDVKRGTEVVTVECPPGHAAPVRPSFRLGAVSQVTPIVLADGEPSTALLGGAVLTLDGTIAGLVSRHQGAQDLVTPLPLIHEQLTEANVETELGQVDRDFRAGLDAYFEGRYTDSIERFDAVLAVIPSHIQAHEYRDRAQAQREAEGGGPRAENRMIGTVRSWLDGRSGSLVAVALLAAIAVFLVRRKGHPRVATVPVRTKVKTPAYCDNCSNALPPAAATCPTCGKSF